MNSHYKIAAYIRLSKEDTKNKESESINNQRNLIKEYLNHHNLKLTKEYIDDGFTGTTFNRPAFNQMITDIENGKINMVITKDLSRLGRNYVKSGYYIEEYFPNKKVRYVSILDNVDTIKDTTNNDIAPFKSLFNDMVSKDTSKKIKSILKSKKKQGLYLASKAPYGYKKNPHNKHQLIIETEEAKIIKKIYTYYLNGKTINEIAQILNKKHITPPNKKQDHLWSYISIYNILKNPLYTGITIQNVWTNISYKNKTRIKRDKEEWIINHNAHKPIISQTTFKEVNQKLKNKETNPIKPREKLLLEGIIYCHECHHTLGINKNKNKYILICNNYKKNSHQKKCTPHYTNYQQLENEILKALNKHLNLSQITIDNTKKIQTLKHKLEILYEDRLNKIITLQTYKEHYKKIQTQIQNLKQPKNIKVSRDVIRRLIDKITIDKNKNITIYYKFQKP